MDDLNSVLCFGGLHFDRIARCTDGFQLGASNPVNAQSAPGGVANNIARNLSNLDVAAGIASLLGQDSDGDQLLASLKEQGIDSSLTRQHPDFTTAGYTAVLDEEGELALGLADMDIYEAFDPDHMDTLLAQSPRANWWLADANLPAETITHIGKNKGNRKLCAAPVSPSKAQRWKGNLGTVDVIVGNRREAAVLTETHLSSVDDAAVAARSLQSQGPDLVVITMGPDGVVMASGRECAHWSPPPTAVRDVNGAGDAFYAGFLAAYVVGQTAELSLRQGLGLASLSAEKPEPVNLFDPDFLSQRVSQIAPAKIL